MNVIYGIFKVSKVYSVLPHVFGWPMRLTMVFTFLSDWKKMKRTHEIRGMWTLYEIRISVTINSFIGTQPWPFNCILTMSDFSSQGDNSVSATETMWPAKPTIISKKVCPSLVHSYGRVLPGHKSHHQILLSTHYYQSGKQVGDKYHLF